MCMTHTTFLHNHTVCSCNGSAHREHARRVHPHDLGHVVGHDAEDAMAGGLRLAGHDGQFLAKQRIEQCALAGVGVTDDCNVPYNVGVDLKSTTVDGDKCNQRTKLVLLCGGAWCLIISRRCWGLLGRLCGLLGLLALLLWRLFGGVLRGCGRLAAEFGAWLWGY